MKGIKDNDSKIESYNKLKKKHQDRLLLFRSGDWYEAHGNDAKVVAKELGLVLTGVDGSPLQMAAFPHYDIDRYLPWLIKAGHKVAICDYD